MTASDIKSVEIVQAISLESLPTGEYPGRWSGYEVTAIINGEMFRFRTTNGVKGLNVKCLISVGIDIITVATEKLE